MNTIVIYDSTFGNTKEIAKAIGDGAKATVISVKDTWGNDLESGPVPNPWSFTTVTGDGNDGGGSLLQGLDQRLTEELDAARFREHLCCERLAAASRARHEDAELAGFDEREQVGELLVRNADVCALRLRRRLDDPFARRDLASFVARSIEQRRG